MKTRLSPLLTVRSLTLVGGLVLCLLPGITQARSVSEHQIWGSWQPKLNCVGCNPDSMWSGAGTSEQAAQTFLRGLAEGDRLKVAALGGEVVSDGSAYDCRTGEQRSALVPMRLPIIQFVDTRGKVIPLPAGGYNGTNSLRLTDLQLRYYPVPAGAVAVYGSWPDERYDDNRDLCHFSLIHISAEEWNSESGATPPPSEPPETSVLSSRHHRLLCRIRNQLEQTHANAEQRAAATEDLASQLGLPLDHVSELLITTDCSGLWSGQSVQSFPYQPDYSGTAEAVDTASKPPSPIPPAAYQPSTPPAAAVTSPGYDATPDPTTGPPYAITASSASSAPSQSPEELNEANIRTLCLLRERLGRFEGEEYETRLQETIAVYTENWNASGEEIEQILRGGEPCPKEDTDLLNPNDMSDNPAGDDNWWQNTFSVSNLLLIMIGLLLIAILAVLGLLLVPPLRGAEKGDSAPKNDTKK